MQSGGKLGAIHALAPQLFAQPPSGKTIANRKSIPLLHIGVIAALLAAVIVLVLYRGGAASDHSGSKSTVVAGDQRSVPLALPGTTKSAVQSEQVEAAESAQSIRTPAPAPTPAPSKRPESKAIEPVSKVAPMPVVKPVVPEPAAKPPKEPNEPSYAADERELLALPSEQFLLQLLGAESRATIDKFKAGVGRGQNLMIYHTQLRGKPWFIVMTGPYPTRAAAQAAVAQMPEPLRNQQPWPRSVANVQADIRAHSSK
jgi:DamX protein